MLVLESLGGNGIKSSGTLSVIDFFLLKKNENFIQTATRIQLKSQMGST